MTTAELQAKADEIDARAVMDLPRAESNELARLAFKLAWHARRLQSLRDLGDLAQHEDLLTIVAGIDTIVQGINGDDEAWQAWLESQPMEAQDAS